jgi:3',5'-cyclic AMP phosphodiesterase CpdA
MFTLAHLSDLHLALAPKPAELASKRGLGYINWQRKRKFIHRPEVLAAITRDLQTRSAEHVAVTGDLTNFSLPGEYAWARGWLESIGRPADVTVMPGNHDVYVRGAEELPGKFWGDYMRGDDGLERFPFVRRRGEVALIALSTGVPTGPFLATGRLGDRQLARFAEALEQTQGSFRTVLIHHPPLSPPRRFFRRALVWLHGAGNKKIPAIGVPSASAHAKRGGEDPAGYNIFRIEGSAGSWRCETVSYQRGEDGAVRECGRFRIY